MLPFIDRLGLLGAVQVCGCHHSQPPPPAPPPLHCKAVFAPGAHEPPCLEQGAALGASDGPGGCPGWGVPAGLGVQRSHKRGAAPGAELPGRLRLGRCVRSRQGQCWGWGLPAAVGAPSGLQRGFALMTWNIWAQRRAMGQGRGKVGWWERPGVARARVGGDEAPRLRRASCGAWPSKVTGRAQPRAAGTVPSDGAVWPPPPPPPPGWATPSTAVLGGCPRSAEAAGAELGWGTRAPTLCPGSGGSGWAQPPAFSSHCAPTASPVPGVPCTPTAKLCGSNPLCCRASGARRVKWVHLCNLWPRDTRTVCFLGGTGVLVQPDKLCPTAAAGLGTGILGAVSLGSPAPGPWGPAMRETLGCWWSILGGGLWPCWQQRCTLQQWLVARGGGHRAAFLLPGGAMSGAGAVSMYLAPTGSLRRAAARVATAPGAESRPRRAWPAPRPSCPWPGPPCTPCVPPTILGG